MTMNTVTVGRSSPAIEKGQGRADDHCLQDHNQRTHPAASAVRTKHADRIATAWLDEGTASASGQAIYGAACKASSKATATLQAQAAIAGIRVGTVEDSRGRVIWLVTESTFTRQCATLDEVQGLLLRAGVRL